MTDETHMLVQKLRVRRGWSQEQLAELTGLSVRTIQRIERGQAASAESLKALASVFEIDFATLREPQMPATAESQISANHVGANDVSAEEALALAHVRKIKGFYMHIAQYALVMGVLTVVNLLIYPHRLWVIWPALGWGIGLALHGLQTFDKIPFLNGAWEKRQVEKRLGREL
ncbi:2TM domain-containing protein [Bradyrhizobium prioriisuperbiae]|uniref:2TM domain-containing protein n=1 Tax=Bradyrhizobium prioriisuperbiae TaxID=2854389 RepID=UPI0028E4CBCF|nr:2TM domain-containing protein [Bradyrhizobium prioritasuperba]